MAFALGTKTLREISVSVVKLSTLASYERGDHSDLLYYSSLLWKRRKYTRRFEKGSRISEYLEKGALVGEITQLQDSHFLPYPWFNVKKGSCSLLVGQHVPLKRLYSYLWGQIYLSGGQVFIDIKCWPRGEAELIL